MYAQISDPISSLFLHAAFLLLLQESGFGFTKMPCLSSHSLQNYMDLLQLTKTISRLQKWQSKQLLFCVLFQIIKQMQNTLNENQA